MAKWEFAIDISAEHEAHQRYEAKEYRNQEIEGEKIDDAELGRRVAKKIRQLIPCLDGTKWSLHRYFLECLSERCEVIGEDDDPLKAYNGVLSDLYDWGDQQIDDNWRHHMCWINTDFSMGKT